MADIFFFSRRGVECIVDDEVTKRFWAQELESWNLLTRSSYNFRHISLRLAVLWGLGVLVRYGVLLPLRSDVRLNTTTGVEAEELNYNVCCVSCRVTLAVTGITLLLVFTTLVAFLPNKEYVSPPFSLGNCCGLMLCVSRLRSYLSEKIHRVCYRICVGALTAIITYHNR